MALGPILLGLAGSMFVGAIVAWVVTVIAAWFLIGRQLSGRSYGRDYEETEALLNDAAAVDVLVPLWTALALLWAVGLAIAGVAVS